MERINQVDLSCKTNCQFVRSDGIRLCGAVRPGVQCERVQPELIKVFQAHPVTTETIGNDVYVYMEKQSLGVLSNGVVVLKS